MNRKTLLGTLFALAAVSASAFVQPQRINFQGKLIDPATNNPRVGPVDLTFKLYNDPTLSGAGNLLYTEAQTGIALTNGVFSVQIGSVKAIPRDLFVGTSVYLGVTVTNPVDAAGEMLPRQNLAMSAYAYSAAQLSDLTDVRLIAGPTYSTFTSAGNLTVPGGVSGSSGTFANGVTASSGTFTATGNSQFSVVTASGVQINAGLLDMNGGGGISNQYGLVSATGSFTATGATQFSLTSSSGISINAGTLMMQHTSGIRADDTGITLSTIDFVGQATDPVSGNAGFMYYNTSTGALKVFDLNGWNYAFGQSLARSFFITTTNSAAIAVNKTAAQMLVEPFYLPGPMMVRQIQVDETTAVGATGDFGIYTSTGGLYLHGGANSLANSTGLKTVTLAVPVFVPPGQYYAVITFNSATGRFAGDTLAAAGVVPGCGTVASGGGTTLPAALPTPTTNGTIFFMFEMNP